MMPADNTVINSENREQVDEFKYLEQRTEGGGK